MTLTPPISLILSCSSIERQVRSAIEYLQQNQPVGKVELFIVSWEGIDFSPLAKGFFSVTTVTFPRTSGLKVGIVQAIRRATTDIVVLLEDHTRLEGNWVERLPQIHREKDADVVGWTMMPFDRISGSSWSGYFVQYGLWGPGVKEGYCTMLSGHNTSYRRQSLIEFDSQLEYYLASETLFHRKLLHNGKKLYLTTEFRLAHAQFLSASLSYRAEFWYGWAYADTRQKTNSLGYGRRLLYAFVIPLKVLMRWGNVLRTPRDPAFFPRGVVLRNALGITIELSASAVGEMCGYLFGTGKSHLRLTEVEVGSDRLMK
jgi:hypothetical protein